MINRPLIFGHRGARKYAPENSISAFKKAIELGLDGVEMDIMSTSDGLPVVVHDDNLRNLTGRRIRLHETPYVDIKDLDIGKYHSAYFAGEKIPTLKEALETFKGTNLFVNLELKRQPRQNKNFVRRVVEIAEEYSNVSALAISSFSRDILYRVGRLAPCLNRSLLLHPKAFFFLDALFFANILAVNGLNPHISKLSPRLMRYARGKNLRVITWTANEPDDIEKAIRLGVDGIITDEPILTMEMVRNFYG